MEKEDLRDKLSFRKILAHYKVKQKPRHGGDGYYVMVPPWSRKKLAVLEFNESTQRFRDFETFDSGDIFTFIANFEKVDCYSNSGFKKVLKIAEKIVSKNKKKRGRK